MAYDIQCELHRVFVANLKARRHELGLTQHQVAGRMGVSIPSYNQLEAGRCSPSLGVVERAAKALECHPAFLLVAQEAVFHG